ncbi:Pyruvate/Phosphoenolpyruvate kinase-like domain-containing protein [Bombardia bombarda]|uniref:Pyruvate/Phosphoenolpyruvate kinase-like domain-containing protein n=1 Tax=Bombardia bombarda TaxID=252184 RepID=A0AA40BY56_9PEZI|nr:Pyruvate/Phosphoenolpyruvate kinase-like domain-containing protein [Bombardia bombarda]
MPTSAAARLRELLARQDDIIVCPGVYDGLTARIALQQGFDCLYMTGAGTSLSRLGLPDLGLTTLPEMLANASTIASLSPSTPLIADADTGYGGPLMVARTVRACMSAGVAGLHLEDQVLAKRCGHLLNKELVPRDVYLSRIRAAVLARQEMRDLTGGVSDIVIIARTDALQGMGFDEAMGRLEDAVAVGADVVFMEGVAGKEMGRVVCERFRSKGVPVLLNMVPGGVTAEMTLEEAREVGFGVVVYPGLMLSAVYEACERVSGELKRTGRVEKIKGMGPKVLFELCGLDECLEFDKKAGGKGFDGGV